MAILFPHCTFCFVFLSLIIHLKIFHPGQHIWEEKNLQSCENPPSLQAGGGAKEDQGSQECGPTKGLAKIPSGNIEYTYLFLNTVRSLKKSTQKHA
jgi:hypothetical protein